MEKIAASYTHGFLFELFHWLGMFLKRLLKDGIFLHLFSMKIMRLLLTQSMPLGIESICWCSGLVKHFRLITNLLCSTWYDGLRQNPPPSGTFLSVVGLIFFIWFSREHYGENFRRRSRQGASVIWQSTENLILTIRYHDLTQYVHILGSNCW